MDFVLPPEEIGAHLSTIGTHSWRRCPAELVPLDREPLYRQVLTIVQNVTGVDFSMYRSTTIKRRIMRRMAVKARRSLDEYLHDLQSDEGEAQALFRDLLINVTSFFRDPTLFDAIKTVVLPAITATAPRPSRCASGCRAARRARRRTRWR